MRVLTIQEPYATFIMHGFKKIETRSWKTNYRGEIYIHAGIGKKFINNINDETTKKLLEKVDLNYGKIICKANLIDCIYMDENFINKIKKEKTEYFLGAYEVGRYAWVLDNIEVLDEKIEVKGKLGIWTYEKN